MEPPVTPDRCCDCNVWGTCSAIHSASCACRKAGCEYTDCRAQNCRNRHSEDEVSGKPGADWTSPMPAPSANGRAAPPEIGDPRGPQTLQQLIPQLRIQHRRRRTPHNLPALHPLQRRIHPPADMPAGDPQSDGNAAPNGSADAYATPNAQNQLRMATGEEEISPA